MKLDNIVEAEKIIKETLKKDPTKDIFPITIVKFLLNREKIMNFFYRTDQDEIKELQSYINYGSYKCEACLNNPKNMLCRKHTSIERIIDQSFDNKSLVCFDISTNVFIYMNEIFKFSDNNRILSIIYAPHTKLIQGSLTEYKVKKVSMISTYLPPNESCYRNLSHKILERSTSFDSDDLMKLYIKCWFNDELSLITIPNNNKPLFCLVPNK